MGRPPYYNSPEEKYRAMIDFDFLEAMDIIVDQAPKCPWQFFLTHPDLRARFAYYPSTGAMVYEAESGAKSSYTAHDAEEVYAIIMSKVNQ